ncbi:MAG TPA: tRNA (adenosine(37)-N6)-threonylcarbamoyltransferase complex transferase subunit TsaD, partial [Devosiaceae bacterium]|nr:tRNA (adenosine(37)-N6)-threonylcarbamoyltransferase complex transferase subunit TsaD [Devosiaceae bacterium]
RSQIEEHAEFGGVVPEIAARAHVRWLDGIVARALAEAGMPLASVDAVAATAGPGLIGGLLVGLTTAKALAAAAGKPLIAVNHLEAHALTARLTGRIGFPYLVLLVSGGHSQIVLARGVGDYAVWGTTIDDALGEAFDKIAKLLSLDFPGGPSVEAVAVRGNPERFKFPRPLIGEPGLDFSFSGLKTAVRLAAEAAAPLSERDVADICASFQAAVVEVIAARATAALERFAVAFPQTPPVLVAAGGVAANRAIASALGEVAARAGARLIVPPMDLCGDNAAMVAWAGAERLALGSTDGFEFEARARWPLDGADMAIKPAVPA